MGQTLEPTIATCEVVLEAERRRRSGSSGESSSSGSSSWAAKPMGRGEDMLFREKTEIVYGIAYMGDKTSSWVRWEKGNFIKLLWSVLVWYNR